MTTAKRSKELILGTSEVEEELGTSEVEEELATSFRRLGYEVQGAPLPKARRGR